MFYRTAGSGPTLVLLHGFPQHSLLWHAIAPMLAEHFTVVVPDQRGVGNTTILPSGYDATTLAADLAGLLDSLEVDKAHVAGYDHGGTVAVAFARDYPTRVDRLASVEMVLPGFGYEKYMTAFPDDTPYSSNWQLALFCEPDIAEHLCRGHERELLGWWFYHLGFSANALISHDHFESYVREISKPGALRAGIMYYAEVFQNSLDNRALHETPLEMPLLVLGGEAALGQILDEWEPVGNDVTLSVIPEAGHWISDENPEFTAAALRDFFLATT
jgi:pimeloyl-ACP methyl ester carboxylesterase